MASKRKSFTPKKTTDDGDAYAYFSFMAAMLAGEVVATKLVESRNGNGKLHLDYDDPNG